MVSDIPGALLRAYLQDNIHMLLEEHLSWLYSSIRVYTRNSYGTTNKKMQCCVQQIKKCIKFSITGNCTSILEATIQTYRIGDLNLASMIYCLELINWRKALFNHMASRLPENIVCKWDLIQNEKSGKWFKMSRKLARIWEALLTETSS